MKKIYFIIIVLLILSCLKSFDGPRPSITSVFPSRGWTGVDNNITISGTGFSPVVTNTLSGNRLVVLPEVVLDSNPQLTLEVTFASTTEINAVVPEGAPVGGPYGIKVINPNGKSAYLASAYEVTQNPLITVSKIYPNFGWKEGDTTVTISGSGFESTPTAFLEIPGGRAQIENLSFISSTSLSGIVPKGLSAGGPYDLTVINPSGDAGVLENAFTITENPPPVVTSVIPTSATTQDNKPVTIQGNNFRQVKVVLIDSSYRK